METEVDQWMRRIRRGEFAAAWELGDRMIESRRGARCYDRPRHEQFVWDGAPIENRRVLIRCYHGLGDTLQAARFFPRVAATARSCTVWVQPQLIPLLRLQPDMPDLAPLHDGSPDVDFDVDIESMELAHLFRVMPEEVGASVPYLRVEPRATDVPHGNRRVGLVWRAGGWDGSRSIPFELLEPLFEVEGVTFVSLQNEPRITEPRMVFPSGCDDPVETARLMSGLDLVISVDTMTAHLAGALGLRAWILLPRDCDWRWMDDRDDSPWYPAARLWRQPDSRRWEPVVTAVATALR
jgi:hypothetical protein